MTWDEAVGHALALPGAELTTYYRRPAVAASGHAFLTVGHEADTSFVLHLELALVEMLVATHPDTFWQSPHYAGHATVLVRYRTPDEAVVRDMIARAHAQAAARRPARPRKR